MAALEFTLRLLAAGCEISKLDATTRQVDETIWFEMECLMDLPPHCSRIEVTPFLPRPPSTD